jgi:hypothetical protein
MSKLLWNTLRVSPAALGASLLLAQGAFANEASVSMAESDLATATETEQLLADATTDFSTPEAAPADFSMGTEDDLLLVEEFEVDPAAMDQVTSVSQLSDVQPTDWAFQALQSLVERYGCIAGYPDGTYKGNRALSRYEFAAGLNACLDRINELIAASTANLATKEELQVLQRLQEEFAAELATLRGRVDALEARTSELEANQFSTTTKLNGEVLMTLAGASSVDDFSEDDNQVTFGHRVRLNFDTSFTGKDRLRTRLQAANLRNYYGDSTDMGRLGHSANTGNDFVLDVLYYRFPINDYLTAHVGTQGLANDDIHTTFNPLLDSSGGGALGRFSQRNPTYRTPDGAGFGLDYASDGGFIASLSYLAGNAGDPSDGQGLFDGTYSASAQVGYEGDNWGLGLFYSHAYYTEDDVNLTGSTASFYGKDPFGGSPSSSENLGLQGYVAFSPGFTLGGWVGHTWADEKGSDDDARLLNWAVTFAFPDLGKEGNLGGLVVGQQPYIYDGDGVDDENDPSLHIEAFYRFQLNDNISLTPGVIVVTNPNHDDNNDTAVIGALRTQFRF